MPRKHKNTKKKFFSFYLRVCVAGACLLRSPSAQPIPVSYAVRLASATVYDTRARDEDTVHASLTVFVNGERKGVSIWDGKAWDGSRIEGRRWVTGLHLFGTPRVNNVSNLQVSTGRLQDTDTVQIVFEMLNASIEPSSANHEAAAARIQQAACTGGDGGSAWECLAPQAASILGGWSIGSCGGQASVHGDAAQKENRNRRDRHGDQQLSRLRRSRRVRQFDLRRSCYNRAPVKPSTNQSTRESAVRRRPARSRSGQGRAARDLPASPNPSPA